MAALTPVIFLFFHQEVPPALCETTNHHTTCAGRNPDIYHTGIFRQQVVDTAIKGAVIVSCSLCPQCTKSDESSWMVYMSITCLWVIIVNIKMPIYDLPSPDFHSPLGDMWEWPFGSLFSKLNVSFFWFRRDLMFAKHVTIQSKQFEATVTFQEEFCHLAPKSSSLKINK